MHLYNVVPRLRQVSEDIKETELETFVVPIKDRDTEVYPLGIQPGEYTKEQLSEALHFIADMME